MSDIFTPPRPLQTAVLFLVFNRPETTMQVFEAIRKARPPRLYVAADGPRADCAGETEKVSKVREIATAVDWPCEVKTLFREKNLGCKYAVSEGITWFFQHEEQGIILEDDCLPHSDFFIFCQSLLNLYALDERVWMVTGNNFQNGTWHGEASYYFSRYNHVWGWASWRRAWQKVDIEMQFWRKWKMSSAWKNFWSDPTERKYWEQVFDRMYKGKIDTWDYPWTANIWYQGGLTATPNVNLVSNIGFGPNATHTVSCDNPLAGMTRGSLRKIEHPFDVAHNAVADRYVFDHIFEGRKLRFPFVLLRIPRRVIGFIHRQFGKIFSKFSKYLNLN